MDKSAFRLCFLYRLRNERLGSKISLAHVASQWLIAMSVHFHNRLRNFWFFTDFRETHHGVFRTGL